MPDEQCREGRSYGLGKNGNVPWLRLRRVCCAPSHRRERLIPNRCGPDRLKAAGSRGIVVSQLNCAPPDSARGRIALFAEIVARIRIERAPQGGEKPLRLANVTLGTGGADRAAIGGG